MFNDTDALPHHGGAFPIITQSQYSIMIAPRREYGPQNGQAPNLSRTANVKNVCALFVINQRNVLANSNGISGTCKLTFIELHLHSQCFFSLIT